MRYFWNTEQFPWVQHLRACYQAIKQEWNAAPEHLKIARHTVSTGLKLEKNHCKWDLVRLMDRNQPLIDKHQWFPVTMSLIDTLPIYENLCFSIFYPGTETIPHKGWSKTIVRVHMAIDTNDQAALICGNECVSLKNGEVLIFEDGEEHFAYNRSDRERIMLMFDVLKTDLQPTSDI